MKFNLTQRIPDWLILTVDSIGLQYYHSKTDTVVPLVYYTHLYERIGLSKNIFIYPEDTKEAILQELQDVNYIDSNGIRFMIKQNNYHYFTLYFLPEERYMEFVTLQNKNMKL